MVKLQVLSLRVRAWGVGFRVWERFRKENRVLVGHRDKPYLINPLEP